MVSIQANVCKVSVKTALLKKTYEMQQIVFDSK